MGSKTILSPSDVGRAIRLYRNCAELPSKTVAASAEISANYLSLIERGKRMPSLNMFLVICGACHASASEVLFHAFLNKAKRQETPDAD